MENETVELSRLQKEEASMLRKQRSKAGQQALSLVMKSSKWVKKDSLEFKAVKSALTGLNQLLEQEPSRDNVRPFQEAHELLGTACKNYLEKNQGAITKKGQHRLDLVHAVQALYSMEKEGMDQLRSKEYRDKIVAEGKGKTWDECLGLYRRVRAEVSEKDIIHHGAGMSSRMEVKVGDKSVFFTKSSKSTGIDQYAKDFIEGLNNKDLKTALEYEFLMSQKHWGEKRNFIKDFVNKSESVKEANSEEKTKQLAECLNECLNMHKNNFSGYFLSVVSRKENLQPFHNFAEGYKKKCTEALGLRALEVPYGTELPPRNIATRRMAELLGIPDVVVDAGYMDLVIDGKKLKGVYTSKAEGIDLKMKGTNHVMKDLVQDDNCSFQKEVSGLHLLDAICGQIDRHAGNMLYRVVEKDGKKVLSGVKGIDNEMCFGLNEEISTNQICHMGDGAKLYFMTKRGEVETLPAIDGNLASNIMALDRDVLQYTLGDILNKAELGFLARRVEKVQEVVIDKVRKGQILYEDSQWTEETASRTKAYNNYYGKLTRYFDNEIKKENEMEGGKERKREKKLVGKKKGLAI